jgi:hypothetical protein
VFRVEPAGVRIPPNNSCDQIGEPRAVDELHHEALYATGFLDAIDCRDVGMVERRQHLGFALKRARRSASAENDEGRTLIATWRFSFVSTGRADFIGAEPSTGGEGHEVGRIIALSWLSPGSDREGPEPRIIYIVLSCV